MTAATALDAVTEYALDVIGGRVVTGKWARLACERHLRDMDRQGEVDFPWVFDPEKAERVFDFAGFCHHVKGPLAGQPIVLDRFQKLIVGSIFAWVHRDTGLRRIRKVYIQLASGNAKSTLLGVISLYMLMADGEAGAEVYATATKSEQARIVYDLARVMAERSPDLLRRLEPGKAKIEHRASASEMKPLSKDTKSLDGLNPHLGIIDEYHAHPTSDMYDILIAKMVKRLQPMLVIITTAGFDLAGPCYAEYLYCCKVLSGIVQNESYFIFIAQIDQAETPEEEAEGKGDSPKDESTWIKANPLVATTAHGISEMRAQLAEALDDPRKMRNFLTKNMNVWVDQKPSGYLPMEKWRFCGVKARGEKLLDLAGRDCYIGVDLAATTDLASVTFEFPLGDERYAVLSHSFMPEDKLVEKRKQDKVTYDLWVDQGYITATPGAVVDYDFIEKYIEDNVTSNKWKVKELCADPWNATQFATNMGKKGYLVVEIRQGVATLSGPTKDFREKMLLGKVIHDDNPVLTWAMSNAVTRQDHNQNIMLDKSKARERIDPAAATINAHVRAVHYDAKPQQQQRAGISRL